MNQERTKLVIQPMKEFPALSDMTEKAGFLRKKPVSRIPYDGFQPNLVRKVFGVGSIRQKHMKNFPCGNR